MTAFEWFGFALSAAVGLYFAADLLRGLLRVAWWLLGSLWALAAGVAGFVFAVTVEDGKVVIHYASESEGKQ